MLELVCLSLHIYATNAQQGVQVWVASTSQLLGVSLYHFECLACELPAGTYDQAAWTFSCKYACPSALSQKCKQTYSLP